MDLEQAIRTRRTHKAFGPQAVAPALLDELFELARWAPNHHLTNPSAVPDAPHRKRPARARADPVYRQPG